MTAAAAKDGAAVLLPAISDWPLAAVVLIEKS
jgi:hypothetical protein